nr:MAG TPA: hypothetical protein [Caudoviricetes sp.]
MISHFTSITPITRSAKYTNFPTTVAQIKLKLDTVMFDIEHHGVRLLHFVSDNGLTILSLNLGDLDYCSPDGTIIRTEGYDNIKDGVLKAMRAHHERIA